MKGTHLGEFEELVLLSVGILDQEAYGVGVKQEIIARTGRNITLSTVHSALHRLEKKGFLESKMGEATKVRGGKRKKLFFITSAGKYALETVRNQRNTMWNDIPGFQLDH